MSEEIDSTEVNSPTPKLVHEFKKEFEKAEILLKDVEEFCAEVAIPAINELRYAGYHLVASLTDQGSNCDQELIKAINHCKRATYDAGWAGVVAALESIDEFANDFSRVPLNEAVDEWPKKRTRINEIRDSASLKRTKGDDKENDHSIVQGCFLELRNIRRELEGSRDDLLKIEKKDSKDARRFVINSLIAILAIVVAIVFGVLAL